MALGSQSRDKRMQFKHNIGICIDKFKDKLFILSQDIWSCPELAYEEKQSHDRLVRFLADNCSWNVESHYKLPTAFRATWGPFGGKEGDRALHVCFLCEYDALPGIGHACGHNLIAEVGVAAALGLAGGLQTESAEDFPQRIKVTVLGTPAEEDGGGKVDLILAGAFEDIDVVFMAHPAQQDVAFLPCVSIADVTVKYYGKASHAAAYPWEGVNALDAAVLAYNSLSVLRQQLKPDWRLHGIIKHGGVRPNIIPAYTEMEFYLRTPLLRDLSDLKAKAEACFRSAATATGCQLYEENGRALGIQFEEVPSNFLGSTDFGNVSFIVPGIHPFFHIGSDALNHTGEYTAAAGRTGSDALNHTGEYTAAARRTGSDALNHTGEYTAAAGRTGSDALNHTGEYTAAAGRTGSDALNHTGEYTAAAGRTGSDALNHTGEYTAAAGRTGSDALNHTGEYTAAAGRTGSDALNHTGEYTAAAGAEKAQFYTLRTAKALAMTAMDVICCPELLQKVQEEFSVAKLRQDQRTKELDITGTDTQ
ncbi:peptidase M20 domain-containing protein 2 isoform X2 [Esox lucius]|uniref:peptidase M20 domain-containing protein 2 isoform X2 n=1 Tax=Esox lucius TaxID=8010 RepID=UPI001476A28D|nr:peptidase M20 domain-containing protein 2 isoform X2 [Esox lucius]